MRIGNGYDIHAYKEGRKLILGGVEIPYERGLDGHSDADVLTHAIMDSLLGAIGSRDIGYHFPDTDPRYKDISSLLLLKKVVDILKDEGYKISNIDTVILCQEPKLSNYINQMKENLSDIMNVSIKNVSIKATTTEKLGPIGRLEGISVHAVALVKEI